MEECRLALDLVALVPLLERHRGEVEVGEHVAQAAVYQTANTIDRGEKPAVPSAILKSQLTEFQRVILGDAMDIHGGKAVTLGPRNYLAIGYSANPVAITVEGANIMTRNLMIFGQGAIRCHPYVLEELAARDADDIQAFDKAFFGHAGLIFGNAARAFTQGLGLGRPAVPFQGEAKRYAQEIARLSAGFGLCADAAMASLGSTLKQREMLSARLGDVLANLYLASMVIKQWHEGDKVEGEAALFHYSCQWLLGRTEQALDELFDNLPNRALARVLRLVVMPRGKRFKRPHDDLARTIAQAVSRDTALREKLLANTWAADDGSQPNFLARYNALLATQKRAETLYRIVNKAYAKGELPTDALHPEQRVEAALEAGLISTDDATFMREREARVLELLTVDDFEYDAFVTDKSRVLRHNAA